jgi:hypothetical protein
MAMSRVRDDPAEVSPTILVDAKKSKKRGIGLSKNFSKEVIRLKNGFTAQPITTLAGGGELFFQQLAKTMTDRLLHTTVPNDQPEYSRTQTQCVSLNKHPSPAGRKPPSRIQSPQAVAIIDSRGPGVGLLYAPSPC